MSRIGRTSAVLAAASALLVGAGGLAAWADTVSTDGDTLVGGNNVAATCTEKSVTSNSILKYQGSSHFSGNQNLTVSVTPEAPIAVSGVPSNLALGVWSSSSADVSLGFTTSIPSNTPAGNYKVNVSLSGNQVGGGTLAVSDFFNVDVTCASNATPTVATAANNATGNEGDTLGTAGAFADAEGASSLTITKTSGAGTLTPTGNGGWTWSLPTADQTSGDVTVRATDAGGLFVEDTFSYSATNVAPMVVNNAADANGTEGVSLTNGGSFTDVSGDRPLSISLTGGPGSITVAPLTNSWSWSYTPPNQTASPVLVTIEADDGDGGKTTDTFSFTAQNANPTVSDPAEDVEVDEGAMASTSGAFADVPADTLNITHSPSLGTLNSNPNGAWSWSYTTVDDYNADITVTADDGDTGSATDVFRLNVNNVPPVAVTGDGDVNGVEGVALSTTGSFTDPAGAADPLTITKTNGAGTVTDNGDGTWSWSHTPNDNGTGSVTVTANDGDGGTTPVTFDWTAINVAPVGTTPTDKTGDEGSELTASGTFTDVPADPLVITQTDGAGAVTDNGDGTWSWSHTPNDNGTGSVTVTANDGDGGTTPVTFNWTAINVAPVGTTPADKTGNEGSELTASGTFTDVPADPLVITQTDGAGAVTDNGDGTWSWSHTPNDNGSGTVTVAASDGDGGTTSVTFKWTANNVAPTVSASFGGQVECGVSSVLTLSIADPGSADTHTAVINWGDGSPNQTVNPATNGQTMNHVYGDAGVAHTAHVTVSDDDGDSSQADSSNTASVAYNTSGILQPVNWTQGTQNPISIFKAGSTIPVKVALSDCDGSNAGGSLSVKVAVNKLTGSTPTIGDNESITNTNTPDSSGYMRWTDPNYMYNLNTKSLPDATATYRVTLTVETTDQKVWADFGLKAK